MKKSPWFLSALLLTLALSLSFLVSAQEKNIQSKVTPRWELEFTNQPPEMFTYVTPRQEKENYWYMIYTLTNSTDDTIKLGVDICIRAIINKEKPDTDKYYQDTIRPFVEDEVIIHEEKLNGLGKGIQKDRIKELKKELKYLNCKDLRDKKEIRPKETIKAIALFNNIDPKAIELEVMVGGLVDVIKWRYKPPPNPEGTTPEEKFIYEYECKIWKVAYSCPGDEFKDQTRPLKDLQKEWLIREYGPIGSKRNIEALIEGLQEYNPLLQSTGQYLLERLTGNNFNYDWRKPPKDEDNVKSIDRWREWWYRNNTNLVYNLRLNKFEIKEPEK